jgi:PAS domain S-box-containing protein
VQPMPAVRRLPEVLAVSAGAVVTGVGVIGIVAWTADLPRPRPEFGPVSPHGAVGLTLAGLALLFVARAGPGPIRRWAGGLLAGLSTLVALLDLLNQVGGELVTIRLFADLFGVPPERASMPAPAAAALLLGGLALLTLDIKIHHRLNWAQALAPAAATIALVTLLVYALEGGAVPGPSAGVAMPLPTAVALLVLAAGVMLARPAQGLLRPFTSLGPGGTVARRLTPSLILLPFGMAVLSAFAVRAGFGNPAVAISISSALLVLVLVLIVSGTARALDHADAEQRRIRDELASERDFTATLVQSLDEGIVVLDRELRVTDVNTRWCRLVGRRREDLVGQRPPYSWQPDEPGGVGQDRRIRRSDGTLVPVLATMAPVLDEHGKPRAFVATYVDIAERKRAEDALAERADELGQANDRLRRTNRQLAEAAEFKSDLMSMVSHEVSQPLSSVASLAELLADEWYELPDDTRQDLVSKIDRNARRLTGMINDMLLLFRLDAGVVSARRASVPVAEVVETVSEGLKEGSAEIVAAIDPELCALVDRGHLWQVLSNLVGNAVKYGEPPIEITCERGPDGVVLAVRDHGKGIPDEYVPRLFERITRAEAGGRRHRGTGLGLFIVRHLVEVNGGTIRYERGEPSGARLVVQLEPADRPKRPDEAERQVAGSAANDMTKIGVPVPEHRDADLPSGG